jgi:hypothetical protein
MVRDLPLPIRLFWLHLTKERYIDWKKHYKKQPEFSPGEEKKASNSRHTH